MTMSSLKAEGRSKNRQLTLNMVSTLISYALTLGISFFLTPFIVRKLGTDAYGFIGLSNTIIGYTGLLTVALNSMSMRFVTLNFHSGDFNRANNYLASTFFGNCGLALLIVLILGIGTLFLERFISIPAHLVMDVKFLFTLMFVNSAVSLVTGIFGFATFIKNRLELSNVRSIGQNVLRAILTIVAYGFFPAHLWYIGAIACVCTIYIVSVNFGYYRRLTPELKVKSSAFSFASMWEMTKSGAWNLLSSFSAILNQGLDLLLANVFISAYFMGIMSLSKSIPWMLLGIYTALSNVFQPVFIKLYAEKEMIQLKHTLLKSMRILGLFASFPCAILFAYGDIFYSCWLKGSNFMEIYHVSTITMIGLTVTMPTQALWYIFTITNTVRRSSLNTITYGIINIVLAVSAMFIIQNDVYKLYAIVTIQSALYFLRYLTFLPFYGAKVLDFPKFSLFIPLLKILASIAVVTGVSFLYKLLCIHSYIWPTLIGGCLFTTIAGVSFNYFLILTPSDRAFIKTKFLHIR